MSPLPVHRPHGEYCSLVWYGDPCGAHESAPIHQIPCAHCGEIIPEGELNTSEVINGFYHGRCIVKLVTFDQERDAIDVGLNWVGRLADAHAGAAIQREAGDMD